MIGRMTRLDWLASKREGNRPRHRYFTYTKTTLTLLFMLLKNKFVMSIFSCPFIIKYILKHSHFFVNT